LFFWLFPSFRHPRTGSGAESRPAPSADLCAAGFRLKDCRNDVREAFSARLLVPVDHKEYLMALKVLLAANLRQYVSHYDAGTGYEMTVGPGASVRDVARDLGIPEDEVKLIMVDGISATWDTPLKGNERVALFPPVGGG
jgi:molybdopterin synthase sulfur carrier subunit